MKGVAALVESIPGLEVYRLDEETVQNKLSFGQRCVDLLHSLMIWPFTWAAVTHLAYWVTNSPLSRALIPFYIRQWEVAVEEAAKPLQDYATVGELFQRSLRPGLRPICSEPASLVSPVDGEIVDCGKVQRNLLFKAKGVSYSLAGLLGSVSEAETYVGGEFAIIYMPAGAYHHVHSPCRAEVCGSRFLPGRHFPLYSLAQRSVPGLYSRNTRQVNYLRPLDIEAPPFALVQIGSTLVGSIRNKFRWEDLAISRPVYAKGEDFGRFTFGSTVILIFPPGQVRLKSFLRSGVEVRVGQKIGVLNGVATPC